MEIIAMPVPRFAGLLIGGALRRSFVRSSVGVNLPSPAAVEPWRLTEQQAFRPVAGKMDLTPQLQAEFLEQMD
jgi:hypothetical protein